MNKNQTRHIILDTETTGLNYNDPHNPDRIIEFAGLEMINRQITGKNLHLYIHPQREISEEAFNVHGINLQALEGKPLFQQVAEQIWEFIRGANLIIHNAKFDVGVLNAEFQRLNFPNIESICTITDTLSMAKELYPGQKASLDALCTRLGVDRSRRVLHGALIDCELLGGVYLAMTRGQFSLVDELLDHKNDNITDHYTAPHIRTNKLPIYYANAEEIAAHEDYLDQLEKTGQCLYRQPN